MKAKFSLVGGENFAIYRPMTATEDPTNEPMMVVEVPLEKLGPATKDYLLANANSGKTPAQLLHELMTRAAEREGFLDEEEESTG